jgi:hypothetical protein
VDSHGGTNATYDHRNSGFLLHLLPVLEIEDVDEGTRTAAQEGIAA